MKIVRIPVTLCMALFISFLKAQDIIFNQDDWTYRFVKSTPSTVHSTSKQPNHESLQLSLSPSSNSCNRQCIPLDICPYLFALLQDPSPQKLKILRNEACGFDSDETPLVWCNDLSCVNLLEYATGKVFENGNHLLFHTRRYSTTTNTPDSVQFPFISSKLNTRHTQDGHILNNVRKSVCGLAIPERINGGQTSTRGEFPWVVAISIYGSRASAAPQVVCSGSLISDQWVLTAAHCVADAARNPRNVSHIRLGAWNITNENEPGAENMQISRIIYHENFSQAPIIKHDIALIKLKDKVTFGTIIGPICLPTQANRPEFDKVSSRFLATAVGWGGDGHKTGSFDILQKVRVPLVSGEVCKRIFRKFSTNVRINPVFQICAGERGSDSCKGDSGGPLIQFQPNGRAILIGIISFGTIHCDGQLPGVYTKVSSYLSWIQRTISEG